MVMYQKSKALKMSPDRAIDIVSLDLEYCDYEREFGLVDLI